MPKALMARALEEDRLEKAGEIAQRQHHTAGRQLSSTEKGIVDSSTATEDSCNCNCHKTRDEVDQLLTHYTDVTNEKFRRWYCKAIYAMGCQVFSDLAEQARKGKDPAKYFSHLLKARLDRRLK